MNWLKSKWVFLLVTVNVFLVTAVPANISRTREKDQRTGSKYVEIKLPVKITSMEDLVAWVKNAMQTMASRIDITLAADSSAVADQKNSESKPQVSQVSESKMVLKPEEEVEKNVQKLPITRSLPVPGFENPWFPYGNDVFPPVINADAYLPLFVGDLGSRYALPTAGFDVRKNFFQNIRQEVTTTTSTTTPAPRAVKIENRSSTERNDSNNGDSGAIPFAIPFEAFITITRDEEIVQKENSDEHEESNAKKEVEVSTNVKNDGKKKESARKRQIAVLGDLLEALGLTKRPDKHKIEGAATTTAGTKSKRPREEPLRPPIAFGEVPPRPSSEDSFQRQEFENELDDDDEEEDGGSLGSVADLLPLALPILEDLSDPESDADLIEILQAGIPILAGLSEPDEDGNGGAKELIDMIVPVVTKIVNVSISSDELANASESNGPDGQGIDLSALIGPIFSLLAPFIGPVLAPVIGPLVRAISNPPTEGSSLGALLAAITGPLSTPQEPSGMSPLAIVIAGTAAALLRELKPGLPGGLDVGALVGAVLTGVISGTSAGLSGGSSDSNTPHDQAQPYGANLQRPASSINDNVIFPGRPSPGPPLNSPFIIRRPNNQAATVNIGSTVRPYVSPPQYQHQQPPAQYPQNQQPTSNYPQYQQSASNYPQYQQYRPQYQQFAAPSRPASQTQQFRPGPTPPSPYNQHTGLVPAAANNNGNYGVPANTVNPLSLIGNTVKELLGGGISLVSTVINAVFGIVGASSASSDSPPAPSYGPPTGHYTQASG
ncbi:hypothetical protein KQX54_008467 [Cotesia glomerata]|uniref:Uncharacterized protein n=1 Tax=Cotesia glomerata TaxID=32391 RepID=A0AAV7J422_COTGL|nr:hypothetical protein KQX54_008467 [Cotesia glomerata]